MFSFFKKGGGFVAAAILLSLASSLSAADYYKWTDRNGNLHFSDSLQNVPEEYRDQLEKRVYLNEPSQDKTTGTNETKQPVEYADHREKSLKRFEVPYKPYGHSEKRVIVTVLFNNSVRAPIAIDTGAPETVISARLAEKLGLFDEDQGRLVVRAGGIGGTAPAVRAIIDTIQVGAAKTEFIPATVLINPISDAFDGLLGLDFVSNFSVTIDSKRKVVIFEEQPADPDRPGGHDREWWTAHFTEFAASRAQWKMYSQTLEKRIHDSMQTVGNSDVKRKAFADNQTREAEKLLEKLDRYASQQAVPTEWRQY